MLVDAFDGAKFGSKIWNGKKFDELAKISLDQADKDYRFRVTHFFGATTIFYTSIWDLLWNYATRWQRVKNLHNAVGTRLPFVRYIQHYEPTVFRQVD